jgi:hypothetical protein
VHSKVWFGFYAALVVVGLTVPGTATRSTAPQKYWL